MGAHRPRLILAALLCVLAGPAWAERVELPIARRVVGAVVRYGVPLTVGGKTLEAGLDTGSLGLRLLPDAAPVDPGGRRQRVAFGGGVELDGVISSADVTVGPLLGHVTVYAASKVGCTTRRPDCTAAGLPPGSFGFMGEGLDGQGFQAILGIDLVGSGADNPLRALGVRRWIVRVPRMAGETGALILDPSDAELAGFVPLPIQKSLSWRKDGTHDGLDGCLQGPGGSPRVCGPVLLDTGAAGVTVANTPVPPSAWPKTLTLSINGGPTLRLTPPNVGWRADERLPRPMIFAGAQPYLDYEVLYDAERGVIGLKPR